MTPPTLGCTSSSNGRQRFPTASKLHIDVTKDRSERDPKDTKKTPVKSMDYVQNVTYVPSATAAAGTPSISGGVKFENEGDAATWKRLNP